MKSFSVKDRATIEVFFKKPLPKKVNIYKGKKLFFFRDLCGQERIKFNINRPGNYTISANCDTIAILPLSIHLLKINLPPHQREEFKKPVFKFNPLLQDTPARNFHKIGVIEYGPAIKKMDFSTRNFIFYHEVGHFYYKDEKLADLWAAKNFIADGFNNSAAFQTLKYILHSSSVNDDRIKNLFENLHR